MLRVADAALFPPRRALKSNLRHCLLQHRQVAALNFQRFEGEFEFTAAYNAQSPCYAFIHITRAAAESLRINQRQNLQLRSLFSDTPPRVFWGRHKGCVRISRTTITRRREMSHARVLQSLPDCIGKLVGADPPPHAIYLTFGADCIKANKATTDDPNNQSMTAHIHKDRYSTPFAFDWAGPAFRQITRQFV
jgi:hypothetical protein